MYIRVENVAGIYEAVYSIRNATQSWSKSDSKQGKIGKNDLKLASGLVKSGDDEAKFARMINVITTIQAPNYWLNELDTYKIGTVRNSTSLQHTGMKRDYCMADFEIDFLGNSEENRKLNDYWQNIINGINYYREKYLETKDYKYFRMMRQLVPMSYEYTITWSANYQVLRNIYIARKNHKLDEWRNFCHMIEGLPYSKELITVGYRDV